jgi:two-component system, NtrC family, response regulator HydG
MQKILIIDDDTYICTLLEKYLKKNGFQVEVAYTAKGGLNHIKKDVPDLVLCDFRLPDADGKQMLQDIKAIQQSIQVVFITGYSDVRVAIQLIKSGAYEYVTKPIFPEEILNIIHKALNTPAATALVDVPIPTIHPSDEKFSNRFVNGVSEKFKEVMRHAVLVAPTEMSVLIQGETGVGKEFIARAIHEHSKRKDKPFVAVDCGAIPKDIANSELFGHVKGAFTSAITNKQGFFEIAEGGTLFLDEIGNLSYEIQVKLLRALQEKVITRLGDNKIIKVDVRIIAATNEELQNAIANASFREDLYHRINEFGVRMPPLRERPDDVIEFANYFLAMGNKELNRNVKGFEKEVIEIFKNYAWYGNLRELKNIVKRSVLLCPSDYIAADILPEEIKKNSFITLPVGSDNSGLRGATIEAEKEAILDALEKSKFNKSKAAELLNVDRKTLYNKIRQYNIEV